MENPISALSLFLFTVISFSWIFSIEDVLRKLFISLLAIFVYFYCGIGVGYAKTSYLEYEIYYTIYIFVLSMSLKYFYKKDTSIPISENINRFTDRYSKFIILTYFLFILMPLAQSGKLGLLINPPAPSLTDHFADIDFSQNKVSGALDSIKNFIVPLFYLSLTKYIHKPKVLLPLILFPNYVIYCSASYMGRGSMAFMLIFVFVYVYYTFPEKRKLLVTAALVTIPSVVIFFAAYVYIRLGIEADKTSFFDSLNFLIESETYYYTWYDNLVGDAEYAVNYIVWIITLPLPGFLKPFNMSFNFNALFTMEATGLGSLSNVSSIALPGLVNESIFIFGKKFFFIHAVIFAWVFSITYNSLSKNKDNFLPLLSTMLVLAVQSPRGGTSGPYSDAIKLIFTFFVFYILSRSKQRDN